MTARRAGRRPGRALAARALAACALAACALGCASRSPMLTTPEDYAAYRTTRIAPSFEGRLAAAAAYLERHPDGAFTAEVRAYLDRAEPVYYGAKRGSIAGLEAYLRTLPAGAFRTDALGRLAMLRRERAGGDPLVRAAAASEERLGRELVERRRVRAEIFGWIRLFLDRAAWDRPFSEAPADLVVPFGLSLPIPVCATLPDPPVGAPPGTPPPGSFRCAKLLGVPYTVKNADGAPEAREATIEVALTQDPAGRLLEAAVGGPDLFLRLEETRSARAVAPDDTAARIGGVSQGVEIARSAFRARLGDDPACQRPVAAPVVLDLACGGMRLVVRAATEPGGDDVFAVTRAAETAAAVPAAPAGPVAPAVP